MPRQRRNLALTGPDEGRQPTSSAVRTSSGHASVSFQMPCSVSPHSWPTRATVTRSPAAWQRRSATHFDCP
jgi:hypothetical protein